MKELVLFVLFILGLASGPALFASSSPFSELGQNTQTNLQSDVSFADKDTPMDEPNLSNADKDGQWQKANLGGHHLAINPLRFTNRSSCADDASKPATTANLLIDSMYPAKMVYRLAQATGQDPKYLTKEAVARFRTANYRLIELIAKKLIKGELPLLHAELSDSYFRERFSNHQLSPQDQFRFIEKQKLENYSDISKNCRLDENCHELDLYLEDLWNAKNNRKELLRLDNFTEEHFVSLKKVLDNSAYPFALSCHYLKKFSPLMAQVGTVKANKKVLESMALTAKDQNEFISSCDDLEAQSSLDAVAYQLDLLNLDPTYWNRIGFDFWHTLKLFYSWSFRHAKDISSLLYPFENIFPSIALEETVMLFSTDCRGLMRPKCDSDFLSQERIRDFAKLNFTQQALNYDFMKEVPQGSEQELLDHPFVDYNNDVLDYGSFSDLGDWAKNMANNLRRARTHHTKKFLDAITFLDKLFTKVSAEVISNNLKKITDDRKSWSTQSYPISLTEMKNQLYYLCAEFQIARHRNLSFIKADMDLFLQSPDLKKQVAQLTGNSFDDLMEYFDSLSQQVFSFCQVLEKKNVWKDFEVDRSGFAPWFQELVDREVKNPLSLDQAQVITPVSPFLTEKTGQGNTILCHSAVDCARLSLQAVVGIYATQKYYRTVVPDTQSVSSPSLQNPYAERTACKIYDPWWKVKKTLFNTISDLSAAAINLVNPTPFFISVDYVPQRAISFKKLVEDGQVVYDPEMSGQNWFGTANIDLLKILNIPCTVSLGNHAGDLGSDRRYFSGYTFKGCAIDQNGGEITVTNPSDIDQKMANTLQGCLSCSINFETVGQMVAQTLNIPYVSSGYYLIRGITNFFRGFSDPIEIPHRWEVDVNNVYQTYRRYGEIPEQCVGSLVKGNYCLPKRCDFTISQAVGRLFDAQVESIDYQGSHAYVKLNRCRQEILLTDYKTLGLYCRNNLQRENFMTNSSCQFPAKGVSP